MTVTRTTCSVVFLFCLSLLCSADNLNRDTHGVTTVISDIVKGGGESVTNSNETEKRNQTKNSVTSSEKHQELYKEIAKKPPDFSTYTNISEILSAVRTIKNELCRNQTIQLFQELSSSASWAVQMFDASVKAPVGVAVGSTYNFGNFDECVGVRGFNVTGKYCLADFIISDTQNTKKNPARSVHSHYVLNYRMDGHRYHEWRGAGDGSHTLHWALCIPSSCSARDLKEFLNTQLSSLPTLMRIYTQLDESMCHVETPQTFDKWDMMFLCFLVSYGTVIVFGTLYSLFKKNEQSNYWEQTIMAFSVTDNLKKLVSYTPTDLGLDCLYGYKAISMTTILTGHTLLFLIGGPVYKEQNVNKQLSNILNEPFLNNQLFVDSFFLVSGFLLCRLMMDEMTKRKGKSLNLPLLFIIRYVRLTPAYAVVIFFYATLFYKMDSGPLWDARIGAERDRCIESWWLNLLYVNNYVNTDSLCMFQSWYVAADTHLFAISIIAIYLLWNWPTFGKLLLFVLTIFSLIIPFIVTLVSRLDPLIMIFKTEITDISTNSYFKNAYIKTHMKGTAYFCGVILGYVIHRLQQSDTKIPKSVVWTGWVLSPLLLIASLYSAIVFYDPDYKYYAMDAALYSSLDRFGWCIGCSWIIFSCVTRNSDSVNNILSWRLWVPFSRLSYSAFLVNGIVLLHNTGTLRSPQHIDVFNMLKIIISQVILTYAIGLVLSITFESPLNSIQKVILNAVTNRSHQRNKESDKKNLSST